MRELTEVQKRLIEKRVEEITDIHNRQTLRSIISNLFKRADKGSRAFYELEDKWGFTGDYTSHDDNYPNDLTENYV